MNNNSDFEPPENLSETAGGVSKIQHFESAEMLVCTGCGRTSPPTRVRCFYCNQELPVSDAQRKLFKPKLRPLEEFEKGFNLIAAPFEGEVSDSLILKAAHFLEAEPEKVRLTLVSQKYLPLVRAEFYKDAEVIAENLAETGLQTLIVKDDDLRLDAAPRRLRSLEFGGDSLILILFNTDEILEIPFSQPLLVVSGAVFERRIDSREDLKARKKKNSTAEITETGTDYLVMDLYPLDDQRGFRIASKGFDFSCLDSEKSLLVKDNMMRLKEKLGREFTHAAIDDDYLRVRAALANVWAAVERKEAGGIDRPAFAGAKRLNSVTIDSLQQFNRYSRLQNIIYEKKTAR